MNWLAIANALFVIAFAVWFLTIRLRPASKSPNVVQPMGRCSTRAKAHKAGKPESEVFLSRDAHGRESVYVGVGQCTRCFVPLLVVDHAAGGSESVWEVRA